MNILNRGIAVLLIAVLTLIGCGGGDGGGGGGTATTTGKFIDATVVGMDYKCGTSTTVSGKTTANGEYTCPTGQAVAFYVGDILIGSVSSAMAIVTPLDLVGANAMPSSTQVINIVRFLMSISSTDPAAGATGKITIDSAVIAAAANKSINFATITATDLDSLITTIKPLAKVYTNTQATAHITSSINGLFAGNYAGTYSGAASGNWNLTIAANGTVTGTSDAGAITGSMATTLSTGSTYAFTGNAGSVPWVGTLNVSTKAFGGTWNDGAGNSGTFTGTASSSGGGGSFVTTCIANNFSHGVTAAQLTPFVRSYTGNLYAQPTTPGGSLGAPGAAVNLAIAANGGITYNGTVQPVSSLCMDNANSAQIYVTFASGVLSALDFFTDGGVTGNLSDANVTIVQGGSCATVAGCGTGGTGGTTPTVTGFSPATGAVGTTVTITGTNLGLGFQPAPIVKFGTTAVTTPLTFNGQTSISFAVPVGLGVGAHTITIGGATGTPITVGTFTVTAGGGGATGLIFSPAFNGVSTFANSAPMVVSSILLYSQNSFQQQFSVTYTPASVSVPEGLTITTTAASGGTAQAAVVNQVTSANNLSPSCTLTAHTLLPTCSNAGIAFNKTGGTVSFTNTPMAINIGSTAPQPTAFTVNGTLTFPPF